MNAPLFDSLEIRLFRAFDFLKIEQLGHINLILGKNNVGKSTLLEALYLHANMGSPHAMWAILAERDEPYSTLYTKEEEPAIWGLFHGHPSLNQISDAIYIGRIAAPDSALTLSVMWGINQDNKHIATNYLRSGPLNHLDIDNDMPVLIMNFVGVIHVLRVDEDFDALCLRWHLKMDSNSNMATPCIFVPPNGFDGSDLQTLWEKTVLTDAKREILDALRVISPEVEDFALFSPRHDAKAFHLRLQGHKKPIPAKTMGDGINRLIGLSMALVSSQDGILLVDEIENGLHWSVLPTVWKFILKVAKRLNVQVFATTHSHDCLRAFQIGTKDDADMEGVAVRLENKQGEFHAEIFDEKRLALIVKEGIEIR